MHHDDVVVTGRGACCNLGGDLTSILDQLRTGQPRASFERWPAAVEHNGRCQLKWIYPGDLSDAALGIAKSEGRFMGRTSRLALHAARAALAESKIDPTRLGIVVGSGTGDVDSVTEIHDRVRETGQTMKISPVVVKEGWIAPAIHAVPLDPELEGYPPILEAAPREMRYAMSNSFGFGGSNVSLVLSA